MIAIDELVYVAVGGSEEIGANCYLYGIGPENDKKWMMVDLGITFGNMETSPGVETILPDIHEPEALAKTLEGVFVTHAHEDHIGAIPFYANTLGVKIYATKFTAEILKDKFEESGISDAQLVIVGTEEIVNTPSFEVEFIPVHHSIAEASALLIRTRKGNILHTGDFRLESEETTHNLSFMEKMEEIGRGGLQALVCESTNAIGLEHSGYESDLLESLENALVGTPGAIVITSFSSNLPRFETINRLAEKLRRTLVIAGRSIERTVAIARKTGLLSESFRCLTADEARDIPKSDKIYLVSGSQAERFAVLARIARQEYKVLTLAEGDVVVFSSRDIPGNELGINHIKNQLTSRGVKVLDGKHGHFHVSGHLNRFDLEEVYRLTRPRVAIPMHGEIRHLSAHAELARNNGVAHAILATNGDVIRISGNSPGRVGTIPCGKTYVEGSVKYGSLNGVVQSRLRLAREGIVLVALQRESSNSQEQQARIELLGVPNVASGGEWTLEDGIRKLVSEQWCKKSHCPEEMRNELAKKISRFIKSSIGRRAVVRVFIDDSNREI